MKRTSLKANYLFNVGYQIFAMMVPLITTPYISRVLGAEGIGQYSFTYSIVRYFLLFAALGSATYGIRTIGIYQNDKKKRSKAFWEILIFRVIMSLIMLVAYTIYVLVIAESKLIAMLQGLYIIGIMVDVSWFFQGLEDFKKIAIRNFIIKITNIIYIFIFVKVQSDLWKYVLGLATFTVLGNLSILGSVKKYIGKVPIRELKPFKNIKVITQLFMPTVATQIYSVIDKSMIGWLSNGTVENGYYEQALKIVEMSLILITTLGGVLIPRISREYANNEIDSVKKHLTKSYQFVFLMGVPLTLGIYAISDVLVINFLGDGFEKDIVLLPLLSLLYIPMGINNVTGVQYLISTQQQNTYTKFLIAGGIVNVLFNLILIPKLYSIGAAIATVIGEVTIMVIGMIYLQRSRQYNFKNIIGKIYKYILSGIIMLFFILIIKNVIGKSLIALIILIAFGAMVYFIILNILRDELITSMIKKVVTNISMKMREKEN